MKTSPEFSGFLARLFPEAGTELMQLYASAAENAGLLRTDFYTIRDLLDLSGYGASEPLHALLLDLLLALEEGSLRVETSTEGLARRLADLVGPEDARSWAEQIKASLSEDDWPELIGAGPNDNKPVILKEEGGRTFLYFQKYLKHELDLREELGKRLSAEASTPLPGDLRSILKEVLDERPLRKDGLPVRLNRDQQRALVLGLLRSFAIVSGGPGTGKTAIVFTLLRCLARCGISPERIALAAPTGRAAQRLTEAVRSGLDPAPGGPGAPSKADLSLNGLTAQTLHQLLGYNPERGTFRHHQENPLPRDVVIVDEVSMVGLVLMAQLFRALAPETRLILLGDKDQLPSVEAGAVLANLAPAGTRPAYSAALCRQSAALRDGLDWKPGEECITSRDRKGAGIADTAPLRSRLVSPSGEKSQLVDVLVALEENYRSQPEIQKAARAINLQQTEVVEQLRRVAVGEYAGNGDGAVSFAELEKQPGCWLLDLENAGGAVSVAAWRQVLDQWAERHYLAPAAALECYQTLIRQVELADPQELFCTEPILSPSAGGAPWATGRGEGGMDCITLSPPTAQSIITQQRALLDQIFAWLNRARVLTLVREGPWGCVDINRYLEERLRPRLDCRGRSGPFAGAPLLITRNDHARQLFNGDVGVTLFIRDGGYRAVFPRLGGYVSYPAHALPAHELAFAMTVHKSQGSEYSQVLLVAPPEGGRRLLTKEIIYTGITRAKDLAMICSTKEALRFAIGRKIERESSLLRGVSAMVRA